MWATPPAIFMRIGNAKAHGRTAVGFLHSQSLLRYLRITRLRVRLLQLDIVPSPQVLHAERAAGGAVLRGQKHAIVADQQPDRGLGILDCLDPRPDRELAFEGYETAQLL